MKVENVMTRPVESVWPGTNLGEVIRLMWEHDCGVIPVVDEAERLIDLITDRDLCIVLGTRGPHALNLVVGELVRGSCFVAHPWEDLDLALEQMARHQVRRLPVTDKAGMLVGMLSIGDLIRVAGSAELTAERMLEVLRRIHARPFELAPTIDTTPPAAVEPAAPAEGGK